MATIQKRGSTYKITVSCGYDGSGKQIRKHMTWIPERCRNGQILDGSMRFSDFTEMWFSDYAEKQLRPKTLARYRSMLPRIHAALGHIKIEKLQPHHLLAFYDNLSKAGIRDDTKYKCIMDFQDILDEKQIAKTALAGRAGVSVSVINSLLNHRNITLQSAEKLASFLQADFSTLFQPASGKDTLSGKTILHHHRLISSILSTAVHWQIIFSNPCDRVKPPKAEKTVPTYLDEVQAAKMLELLEKENIQYRTVVYLLLYTGFRRGELCGLEWADVDFETHVITVRRSSLYLPEKGIFEDETKNTASNRSIKALSIVFDILREFRVWQNEQRLKAGDRWINSGKIFTTWQGKPIHPDSITSWFHDFIQRSGLPPIHVHSLRHTNATLQIAGGVPISTVAGRLGHANTATTTKIYIHAIKSADEAAAETLESLLSPQKTSPNSTSCSR